MKEYDHLEQKLLYIQCYKAPEESLGELHHSLLDLQSDLDANGIKSVIWKSDDCVEYFELPGFIDLATLISSTGLGVGIYKLLRLWLDSRNGRRIRIKIGDVELEATQLTKDDFLSLLSHALTNINRDLRKLSSHDIEHNRENNIHNNLGHSTFIRTLSLIDFNALHDKEQLSKDEDINCNES